MAGEPLLTIRLHEPEVDGQSVHFSWSCDPATDFYRREHFTLNFPQSVPTGNIPDGLWLRVMMVCLHNHWLLLRPCRVEIPRVLPPGEIEFWNRMLDAGHWTLEFDRAAPGERGEASRRTIELIDFGPPAGPLEPCVDDGLVVSSFSGGRDSITQAAMLLELGYNPLLVTTTSKRAGSIEFETGRFRRVIAEIQDRTGCEHVEVTSDIRDCAVNDHPLAAKHAIAVSEVTDTLIYFAICWATAWARGARQVFLAAEAEVQESVRAEGGVTQIEHFAYSAVTQIALDALAAPTGIRYSSTIAAAEHFQLHRVLGHRYSHLRDLQYSCYEQAEGEDVCSRCYSCFKTAFYLMSEGIEPSELEIDVDRVIAERSGWEPLGALSSHASGSVAQGYTRKLDNHLIRILRELDRDRVASFTPGRKLSTDAEAGLSRLRATAFAAPDPPPEPGYRAGYVDLLDEPLRSGVHSIFSEHFEPAQPAYYDDMLANTKLLSDWLVAPLA